MALLKLIMEIDILFYRYFKMEAQSYALLFSVVRGYYSVEYEPRRTARKGFRTRVSFLLKS